MDSGYTN